ncbi:hypothetical protein JCM3766R1_001777 [Sporobolomyces carnicolor]
MTIAQEINFGYSPSSSADFDDALNPLSFDDDFQHEHDQLGLDDDEDDVKAYDQPSGAQANGKPKRANNRKGPGNADKRATHNAVERARRESLNGRFSVLAESLPTMRNIKRPSKAMIVNKALDFVYDAQLRERTLVQENNELRREVDQLRARLGMPPLPPPAPLPESQPATQSTMRKNKKVQSIKATTAASSSLKNAPDAVHASASTPSTEGGAYPSPSVSAYSSAGSAHQAQAPVYESPSLASEFATSLFPPSHESAPSPTDTLARATSPPLVHPFLPTFDSTSSVQSASAPATSFASMYNPALLTAHLAAAAHAGMMATPQQQQQAAAAANLFTQQPSAASSYLNNPAILYAMQQQYLAQQHQHQLQQHHHHQQQQQVAPPHAQAAAEHSPAASSASPASSAFSPFTQHAVAAGNDSTSTAASSLWAGTPPSWGAPFSHQTPSAVDGLSF